MNNKQLADHLNKILVGQEGIVTFEFEECEKAPQSLGLFKEIEFDGDNIFIRFSTKEILVFAPMLTFYIIKERVGNSWTVEGSCTNLYIGSKSFGQIRMAEY